MIELKNESKAKHLTSESKILDILIKKEAIVDSKVETGIDQKQYVIDVCKLADAFANKKGFKKSTGYEVMILNKLETLERLDDTVWITNPRKDQVKTFTRKVNLTEIDSMKESTLATGVNFLKNFVDACSGHEGDMRVIAFESTRKQKNKQALQESEQKAKSVFKI